MKKHFKKEDKSMLDFSPGHLRTVKSITHARGYHNARNESFKAKKYGVTSDV